MQKQSHEDTEKLKARVDCGKATDEEKLRTVSRLPLEAMLKELLIPQENTRRKLDLWD